MSISQKWRLEGLQNFSDFEGEIKAFYKSISNPNEIVKSILKYQQLTEAFRQFSSYANCLFSENVQNPEGLMLSNKALEYETELQKAGVALDEALINSSNFETLLENLQLKPIAFLLRHRWENAKQKMGSEKEALTADLALHGYHSWYEFYKQAISSMRCEVETDEVKGTFSCSQLEKLFSHPNREVRKGAHTALEKACKKDEALYAQALRSIIGFRLALYSNRGWKSPIHDALRINYMHQSTIDMMWKKVKEASPHFHKFLDEKAKVFGLNKLSWYDFEAPYPETKSTITYDDAALTLIEINKRVNPDIGSFIERAFKKGWIEAENRPGKAPGGFCTPFPASKESRIYMSYGDTINSFLVLAHELGHAYHDEVCFELPELAQHFPSSVAETASTTLELVALDGLIAQAKTQKEKKRLYYEKAHRHTTFFLNIQARFFFEQELFATQGYVDADRLSEMMLKAQKEAYGDRLEEYHPHFWISKVHFYLTDIPSYNFPYTFGYLLSQAINGRLKKEPKWFIEHYKAFLQDTGRMSVEELVKKHFGQDLKEDAFWDEAIDNALQDVKEFMAL